MYPCVHTASILTELFNILADGEQKVQTECEQEEWGVRFYLVHIPLIELSCILALHQLAILCLSYIDSSKPCHEVKEVRMPWSLWTCSITHINDAWTWVQIDIPKHDWHVLTHTHVKEPSTHSLRMLSSPRISGNSETSINLLRYTNLRKACRFLPYKRCLSLTMLCVDDDEGATKVLSSWNCPGIRAFQLNTAAHD